MSHSSSILRDQLKPFNASKFPGRRDSVLIFIRHTTNFDCITAKHIRMKGIFTQLQQFLILQQNLKNSLLHHGLMMEQTGLKYISKYSLKSLSITSRSTLRFLLKQFTQHSVQSLIVRGIKYAKDDTSLITNRREQHLLRLRPISMKVSIPRMQITPDLDF